MKKVIKSVSTLLLWGFAFYGGYYFFKNNHHLSIYFALNDLYHTIEINHDKIIRKTEQKKLEKLTDRPYFKTEYSYIVSVNQNIDRYNALQIIYSVNKFFKKTGFKKLDIYAIMAHESGFKKNAIGHIDPDDRGICQVNRNTYRWLVEKYNMPYEWNRMFEIDYNIEMATLLLQDYREKVKEEFFINANPEVDLKDFEDVMLIGSYNKGIRGTKRHLDAQKEIQYIDHVNRYRSLFSRKGTE